MKKEDLIKELNKYPDGSEVCIVDWRKNIYYASAEPNSEGINPRFTIDYITETTSPFIALEFENDDYDERGNKV